MCDEIDGLVSEFKFNIKITNPDPKPVIIDINQKIRAVELTNLDEMIPDQSWDKLYIINENQIYRLGHLQGDSFGLFNIKTMSRTMFTVERNKPLRQITDIYINSKIYKKIS